MFRCGICMHYLSGYPYSPVNVTMPIIDAGCAVFLSPDAHVIVSLTVAEAPEARLEGNFPTVSVNALSYELMMVAHSLSEDAGRVPVFSMVRLITTVSPGANGDALTDRKQESTLQKETVTYFGLLTTL